MTAAAEGDDSAAAKGDAAADAMQKLLMMMIPLP